MTSWLVGIGFVALVVLWAQVLWLQRQINALDAHRNRLAARIWELHREALTTVTAHTQRLEEQIAELRSALPLAS
jgi:cell division protein FtsB